MFVCIIFAEVILAESPNIGLKVGITYTYKGVTVRFGFDVVRISQIQAACQEQSNGNALWDVLYTALIGFGHFHVRW